MGANTKGIALYFLLGVVAKQGSNTQKHVQISQLSHPVSYLSLAACSFFLVLPVFCSGSLLCEMGLGPAF